MTTYRSLVSAYLGDLAIKALHDNPDSELPLSIGNGHELARIELRRCSQHYGPWESVRVRLTGGLVITATMKDAPEYGGPRAVKQVRIKPNWTDKTVGRTIDRLYYWAIETHRVEAYRNSVYRAVEAKRKAGKEIEIETVERLEQETGHTIVYHDMTIADCEYWLEYVESM